MSKLAEPLTIRAACAYERDELEDLQRRASLALPEYRAVLEAHPDAIDLPAEQIENGEVLVAEIDGRMAGFAALRRRRSRRPVRRAQAVAARDWHRAWSRPRRTKRGGAAIR